MMIWRFSCQCQCQSKKQKLLPKCSAQAFQSCGRHLVFGVSRIHVWAFSFCLQFVASVVRKIIFEDGEKGLKKIK